MPRSRSPAETLIRRRLTALSRVLPGARNGDVEHLHQARVATRRLREALPLIGSGVYGRQLERDVRRLTQAFGPVRELDVALLTLDELEAVAEAPRLAIARLRQVIRGERRRMQTQMRRGVAGVDLGQLRTLAAAASQESGRPAETSGSEPGQPVDVQLRAARRAEELRTAIENAVGLYLPDRLHAVRIAVKKLRYALELTRELSRSRTTRRINALRRIQDLLGRVHDLEVLLARVRGVQAFSEAPSPRLSSDLDRLERRFQTECRRLHARYMVSRPRLLAICDHARTGAKAGPTRRPARREARRGARRVA